MDLNELNKLYEPMNVHQRPGGGGKTYPYVKSADVFDRLNKTFNGEWSTKVFYQEIKDNDYVIGVEVSVYSENLGKITQIGFGNAVKRGALNETGDLFKSALSKAVKDACKKWGVALYMEDDEPSYDIQATNSSDSVNVSTPKEVPMPQMPSNSTTPVDSMPNFNSVQTPKSLPEKKVSMPDNPFGMPSKSIPQPDEFKQVNNFNSLPKVPVAEEKFIPPEPQMQKLDLPKKEQVNSVPFANSPAPQPTANSSVAQPAVVNTQVSSTENMISDIQTVALNTILTFKLEPGETYESLVIDAFKIRGLEPPNPIPPKEDLTYQQAVVVIKYGNSDERNKL